MGMKEKDVTVNQNNEEEEDDDYCDLDKNKICDNCGKCIETDKNYKIIKIYNSAKYVHKLNIMNLKLWSVIFVIYIKNLIFVILFILE